MHNDAYMSDASEGTGPQGWMPQVRSRTQGFGGYGTITFDRSGRLVGVYSSGRTFQLELMDPDTLEELAAYDLPPRPWYFLFQGVPPWKYIGAGMYFYLDEQDRAIVPTTRNTIQIIQVPDPESAVGFELLREIDLSDYVLSLPWPRSDSVAWVLPDWSGDAYWFATTGGVVGVIHLQSEKIQTLRLEGEIIENSFAVGEEGVFILSDYALYRFSLDGVSGLHMDWRAPYDRGPGMKPGHITRGSGTSVTLMGDIDGVVAMTDNAEPRIHVIFLRRTDGKVLCSLPVFESGKSGTDISMIGFAIGEGKYTAIVENNWGHHHFPYAFPEPGIARVDLVEESNSGYSCEQIWLSEERNIGVFKLSFGSGLVYLYFREGSAWLPKWYLTALDFERGETVYKLLTGTGLGYNNWAGSLFIHPDGNKLYSTTIFGLVMVRDAIP